MSTDFTLYAKGREDTGKGASRRLRRLSAEIPGIVYGGGKTPAQVSLSQREVNKALLTRYRTDHRWQSRRCGIEGHAASPF